MAPRTVPRVSFEGTCGTDWFRAGAQFSARRFGRAGRTVCACIVEVGVDHLVSNDLRERRVACACVFARGRMCVDVGARVPAWTRTIVCLSSSAPIGRACVLVMLALEPVRIRLVYSSTSPPSPIHPSVHPSVCLSLQDPSIGSRTIYRFPYSEGGSQKPT